MLELESKISFDEEVRKILNICTYHTGNSNCFVESITSHKDYNKKNVMEFTHLNCPNFCPILHKCIK